MLSHWRRIAAPIIARVLVEMAGKPDREVRAALLVAYPFGVRRHHPYRIWCDEVRTQTGRRRVPARVRKLQGRPPEQSDPRQESMFA